MSGFNSLGKVFHRHRSPGLATVQGITPLKMCTKCTDSELDLCTCVSNSDPFGSVTFLDLRCLNSAARLD